MNESDLENLLAFCALLIIVSICGGYILGLSDGQDITFNTSRSFLTKEPLNYQDGDYFARFTCQNSKEVFGQIIIHSTKNNYIRCLQLEYVNNSSISDEYCYISVASDSEYWDYMKQKS